MPTTTTVRDLPTWMQDPLKRVIASGEELIQEPYTAYGAPRLAEFGPQQQGAFQQTSDYAQAGQTGIASAAAMAEGAGVGWPGANQASYINPFIQSAIDPAALEITRRHQDLLNQMGHEASMSNAFGGSRAALLDAEQNRNYMEEIGDLYARGYATAYDQAQSAYQTDAARSIDAAKALGDVSELEQTLGLRGADALLRTGTIQQSLEQDRLGLAYEDFLEQRNWPYGQLSYMASLIQGAPQTGLVETTTTPEAQQPNVTGQYLGAGIAGLSLIDRLFNI